MVSGVTYATSHQATNNSNKQKWREERDVHLLANTVTILSLCQLRTKILRFAIQTILVTKSYLASKTVTI